MFSPGTNFCALAGRNVRRERRAARVTQEDLAQRMGLNRTHISDIERGLGNPSVKWLQDVASALSVHPALFLLDPADADLLRKILLDRLQGGPAMPRMDDRD